MRGQAYVVWTGGDGSALRYVACWATPVAPKFVLPGARAPLPPPVAVVPARPVPVPARAPPPVRKHR